MIPDETRYRMEAHAGFHDECAKAYMAGSHRKATHEALAADIRFLLKQGDTMVDNFGDELHRKAEEIRDEVASSVPGLPVLGYKATQTREAIDNVNIFKELEERTLRHIEELDGSGADLRMLAIGRTQIQGAFMFLNRAIFQPGRCALPEDDMLGTPDPSTIPATAD